MNPNIKRLLSVCVMSAALTLAACGGGGRAGSVTAAGDTLTFRYAENLTLVRHDGYTVATLRNPWDTLRTLHTYLLVSDTAPQPAHLPPGTVVRTPLRRSVVYSSVHSSLLVSLGADSAIAGVCDLGYTQLPLLHRRVGEGRVADCGNSMNPNMERLIDLRPDAVLLSPFENSGGYGRVEQLGIPLIECADYMETSALGRAEWMRFYGILFGVEQQADSLFAAVERQYLSLRQRALATSTRPRVLSDLKSGSAWYQPGGKSTVAGFYADAGAAYPFADSKHSGSIPLSFEVVYEQAADAEVWLMKYNRESDFTYRELQSEHTGYTGFKAFRQRNIYLCNTGRVPFYEETPFRPDLLLADFIQIFHPEVGDLGGLRYFCKMK